MEMQQLLLFAETAEMQLIREVRECKESINRVRKGQFAKIGELRKMYQQLIDDVEIIKAGLCESSKNKKCDILEMAAM